MITRKDRLVRELEQSIEEIVGHVGALDESISDRHYAEALDYLDVTTELLVTLRAYLEDLHKMK